jgi:hypothetical protein
MTKQLLCLLPFLVLGCAHPLPATVPLNIATAEGTSCHIAENSLGSTMVSCRFHNQSNQDIATCAQISFVSNIEHQVEYRSQPLCSGILAPNETSDNADLVGGLIRNHLSKGCGRDMQHCTLQIEPINSTQF